MTYCYTPCVYYNYNHVQLSYLVIFKSERRIVYIVLLSLLLYFYIILFFSCFVPFFQSQVFFLPLTLKLLLQVNFPAERSMRSILSYLKFLCSGANEGLSYFIFTAFHIEKSNLNTKNSNPFCNSLCMLLLILSRGCTSAFKSAICRIQPEFEGSSENMWGSTSPE